MNLSNIPVESKLPSVCKATPSSIDKIYLIEQPVCSTIVRIFLSEICLSVYIAQGILSRKCFEKP